MLVQSKAKFVRVSPTKARMVANTLKKGSAIKTVEGLKFVNKKPARIIAKVINSAISDAENNFNLKKESLSIKNVVIDQGPVYRRFRPRARGAASPIQKKTSHITVVLEGEEFLSGKPKTESKPVDISWEDIEKEAKEAKKETVDTKKAPKQAQSESKPAEKSKEPKKEEHKPASEVKPQSWSESIEQEKGKGFMNRFFRRKGG